jgi:hypothetical protein
MARLPPTYRKQSACATCAHVRRALTADMGFAYYCGLPLPEMPDLPLSDGFVDLDWLTDDDADRFEEWTDGRAVEPFGVCRYYAEA